MKVEQLKSITVINGYTESGKTTLLNLLVTKGYGTISTSDYMYELAEKENRRDVLAYRKIKESTRVSDEDKLEAREFIIDYVENHLIKEVFKSRDVFCTAGFIYYLSQIPEGKKVAVNAFNNEELVIIKSLLRSDTIFTSINLRRRGEKPGVDGRELDPDGINIWAYEGSYFSKDHIQVEFLSVNGEIS